MQFVWRWATGITGSNPALNTIFYSSVSVLACVRRDLTNVCLSACPRSFIARLSEDLERFYSREDLRPKEKQKRGKRSRTVEVKWRRRREKSGRKNVKTKT
jgi:hypothetical protein